MTIISTIHFLVLALYIFIQQIPTLADKKSYIVYLGTHSHGLNPTELDAKVATHSHYALLESIMGSSEKANESILYSYNKYINGFVAKLTADEVEMLKKSPNVISVIENRLLNLQTTRSWEFLGLERNNVIPNDSLWNISGYGDGVIIGNIDTGVWPESESFNDRELGPIPSKWKGACMQGSDPTFKCNKKLIGARYFCIPTNETGSVNSRCLSPRDFDGHGTHTLSTAGGSFVEGVSVYGFGSGIAKGGSPKARVAAYKVCPTIFCLEAKVLAAFEAAISDGVNVLSVSIAYHAATDYKSDVVAIGSFHAIRRGIIVVASAGNYGPTPKTVRNIAPWIFTIGSGTLDRTFSTRVYLGNSTLSFKGLKIRLNELHPGRQFHSLIDAASASRNSSMANKARFCQKDSLDPLKVKGKVVVCQGENNEDGLRSSIVVGDAGGVGMIFVNDAQSGESVGIYPLSTSHISRNDGITVLNYINNTANPTAYISNGETNLNVKPAPMMASSSSRGPCPFHPQILKPDVIAPGVNVIAAHTGQPEPLIIKYNILSGTSMSCPHVAGVVGLLKSVHPDWSPASIRSAIMTTATTVDNDNQNILDYNKQQATPFGYGSGHINPNAAANPGLIYNLTESDYLNFLCSIYTERDIELFMSIPYKCSSSESILDFNYPSITISNFTTSATLKRTVTNVGNPGTYEAMIVAPTGISIIVVPSKLKFKKIGEEQTFSLELKINGEKPKQSEYVFGSLVWSDEIHNVRSPIVVEMI